MSQFLSNLEQWPDDPAWDVVVVALIPVTLAGWLYFTIRQNGWRPWRWPWKKWLRWWE